MKAFIPFGRFGPLLKGQYLSSKLKTYLTAVNCSGVEYISLSNPPFLNTDVFSFNITSVTGTCSIVVLFPTLLDKCCSSTRFRLSYRYG